MKTVILVGTTCITCSHIFYVYDYFSTQVLVFQIPEDVTTRSLAMALLSDARMLQQDRLKVAASTALLSPSVDSTSMSHIYLNSTSGVHYVTLKTTAFWCVLYK